MIFSKLWFAYNKTKQRDIYECQDGLCEKAIQHYEELLEFRKDAYLGIAKIEDGKKLAKLKSK